MSSILLIQRDCDARTRLIAAINADPSLAVCGAVDTLAKARECIARRIPDLLVSDLRLPDGVLTDLLRELRPRRSHALVLADSLRDPQLLHALRHGVDAYALTRRSDAAMLVSMRRVLAGESPMAAEIARGVLSIFDAATCRPVPVGRCDPRALSAVDRQLLEWIGDGHLASEVARGIETTPQMIGLRIRALYRRLRQPVHDRPRAPRPR
jgi:DNA-binding NarL/FixJ family response regulator